MRAGGWAIALWLMAPAHLAAEWQIRPFIGFTFGAASTFTNPELASGTRKTIIGVSGGWLGEIFGLEADFSRVPDFFQRDDAPEEAQLVSSAVTTLTGNVVIAMPRRIAGYGLRPYFSGGAGMVRSDVEGRFGLVEIHRTLPALSLGGGVTGFLTPDIGLSWDIRRFHTLRGEGETLGNSIGRERLSFWRATMAVAVRY